MKEYLAETCFEKGWESVDRNFRKLSRAAVADESAEQISLALDRLSSQVDLFADLWLHFHMRFEALVHEYNLDMKAVVEDHRSDRGRTPAGREG